MRFQQMDFEGQISKAFEVEVVVVAGSEGDDATDEDQQCDWIELIQDALVFDDAANDWRTTLPNVPKAWKIELDDEPMVFDRAKLNANYAYMGVKLRVHCTR